MSIAVLNMSENVKMKILITIKKIYCALKRRAQSIAAIERCVEGIRT